MHHISFMKTVTLLGMAIPFLFALPFSRAQDDARPVVDDSKAKVETTATTGLPTLYLVGDSSLRSDAPLRGWAQEIGAFFDPAKINVVNRAIGGRSSRTFQSDGRWDKILVDLKPTDWVVVQFGHNDWGDIGEAGKHRGSLKGLGEETAVDTKLDGTQETVHTFGWYMRKYGTEARAKGASAIFCSMVPHKDWKDGKIVRKERDGLVQWTAEAAKASGAAYIDLNEMVAEQFEKLGPARIEPFFGDKRTHSSPLGAEFNARCVVAGLRALPGDPLETYLSAKGRGVVPMSEFVTGTPEKAP